MPPVLWMSNGLICGYTTGIHFCLLIKETLCHTSCEICCNSLNFMSTLCILYMLLTLRLYATEYSQLTLSTYREISIINIKTFIATYLNLHCIYKHMFLLKNEWLNGAVVSQLHMCAFKSNSAIFLQYSVFCLFSMFLFTHKFMLLWLW